MLSILHPSCRAFVFLFVVERFFTLLSSSGDALMVGTVATYGCNRVVDIVDFSLKLKRNTIV